MRDRLKFKMDFIKNLIADEIPDTVLLDSSMTIHDPAIAGGQIIGEIESRMKQLGINSDEIAQRVSGFEEDSISVDYAVNKNNLNGEFRVKPLDKQTSMNVKIAVGNPPYNDGSAARNPIYHLFLENFAKNPPDYTFKVIQANWFTQPDKKLGKSVRNSLKKLGVYKIVINPYNTFENAKVKTCTVFCRKGYDGDVELIDSDTGFTRTLTDLNQIILYTVDPDELEILNKLKPEEPWTTYSGNKKDTNKWRIVTSYRKENFDITPLNPLKVMEPDFESQGGYRVFASFDTKQVAEAELEKYKSFWHSKLVVWIMQRTRTSTTLDNPQVIWVPKIDIDRVFTDEDLYKHFNLTRKQIKIIEDSFK